MNRRILALILGLGTMWFASPALAGGYVVVLRTTDGTTTNAEATAATSTMGEEEEISSSRRTAVGSTTLQNFWEGNGVPGAGAGIDRPRIDPRLGVQFLTVEGEAEFDGAHGEFDVEDLEYADVGCGGAQAASGPQGALPLLVAGLALLFRRRR